MKGLNLLFSTLFCLITCTSFGQSIDVETERFPGIKKLILRRFNGFGYRKSGCKIIYYFDQSGRAIRRSAFVKRRLQSSCECSYNEKGLLTRKIEIDYTDKTPQIDTTKYVYIFDPQGRVEARITHAGNSSRLEGYSEFDTLNKPTTVFHAYCNMNCSETFNYKYHCIEKKSYDSKGKEILTQRFIDSTINSREEKKYNEFGDIIYRKMEEYLDSGLSKIIYSSGGNRIQMIKTSGNTRLMIEEFEYTYDKLNRWIEKYDIFPDRKVLREKRIYR